MASLLMCRPTHYTIAYEINPWMSIKRQVHQARAAHQWQQLYDVLTRELHLEVALLPPARGWPDLVFTANAGLVSRGVFIRSNFRHRERQGEAPHDAAWFARHGYRVVTLPPQYSFEGEGDALWMGHTLVFGYRFRSDLPAHAIIAQQLHCRVLAVELADRRFYHLDTCFCPLSATAALYYPPAFDAYGRKVLAAFIPRLIPVAAADALKFACNAIVAGRTIAMQSGISAALKRTLARAGLRVREVDLSEFLKAGGSAKCLVLKLP